MVQEPEVILPLAGPVLEVTVIRDQEVAARVLEDC